MFLSYAAQFISGTIITLKLAVCAGLIGILIGISAVLLESLPITWIKRIIFAFLSLIRGLPELLVLFFMYFGLVALLAKINGEYIDISPFLAGVIALSLIFGAYASEVFRGAFLAVDHGQIEAGDAIGFSRLQIFFHIELPQAWRHAIPGLGNLWLVLLKDTSIVTLIGLTDLMGEAKIAATSTHQPFTFYLLAAVIYLLITSIFQQVINFVSFRAERYTHAG